MAKENNPIAVDGDKDGVVQDGTKFERPLGTHRIIDGDTYASLGDTYKTGKQTGFEKANLIYAANSGKNLITGDLVKVN